MQLNDSMLTNIDNDQSTTLQNKAIIKSKNISKKFVCVPAPKLFEELKKSDDEKNIRRYYRKKHQ